uniref:Uncharacterized protein n=1 Tax=Plectus sambesii TaxID=2011161 RepID=A0A914UJQ5_9BILA
MELTDGRCTNAARPMFVGRAADPPRSALGFPPPTQREAFGATRQIDDCRTRYSASSLFIPSSIIMDVAKTMSSDEEADKKCAPNEAAPAATGGGAQKSAERPVCAGQYRRSRRRRMTHRSLKTKTNNASNTAARPIRPLGGQRRTGRRLGDEPTTTGPNSGRPGTARRRRRSRNREGERRGVGD